jgi:hypothetical protein
MPRYADVNSLGGKYSQNAAAAAGKYAEGVGGAGADWQAGFGPIYSKMVSCGKSARSRAKGFAALQAYANCMAGGSK